MKKKSGKCPEYLDFVRRLPCFVCYEGFWIWFLTLPEELQNNHEVAIDQILSEAAHLGLSTSRRGLGQKYPDSESGPLCAEHHRLLKDSHHAGTAVFWQKHPTLDRDGLLRMLWRIYQSTT